MGSPSFTRQSCPWCGRRILGIGCYKRHTPCNAAQWDKELGGQLLWQLSHSERPKLSRDPLKHAAARPSDLQWLLNPLPDVTQVPPNHVTAPVSHLRSGAAWKSRCTKSCISRSASPAMFKPLAPKSLAPPTRQALVGRARPRLTLASFLYYCALVPPNGAMLVSSFVVIYINMAEISAARLWEEVTSAFGRKRS